jgi:hypothetical protein
MRVQGDTAVPRTSTQYSSSSRLPLQGGDNGTLSSLTRLAYMMHKVTSTAAALTEAFVNSVRFSFPKYTEQPHFMVHYTKRMPTTDESRFASPVGFKTRILDNYI